VSPWRTPSSLGHLVPPALCRPRCPAARGPCAGDASASAVTFPDPLWRGREFNGSDPLWGGVGILREPSVLLGARVLCNRGGPLPGLWLWIMCPFLGW